MPVHSKELHRTGRIGWLRATVLGANDGILSTSSLVLGVAAAHATHSNILVAGVAGLVAGAMSMAAGEYVSVHSQADTEEAELELERAELKADDKGEHKELLAIYVARGLDPSLAKQVAEQLMVHDALGAHARDELGISETFRARPIQAALASAASFAVGATMPLLVTAAAPGGGFDPNCCWNFTDVPRSSWWVGCASRWRRSGDRRNTRHVLGRPSHGGDRRHRVAVRNYCLSGTNRKPAQSCAFINRPAVVACNICKSSCSGMSQQLSIGASRLPIRGSSGKRQHYPHESISECLSGHGKRCSSAAATVKPIELSLDDRASRGSSVPQSFRHSAPNVASDAASAPTCWISDIRTDANPRSV
jgi:vacuolar iron transporter family protein